MTQIELFFVAYVMRGEPTQVFAGPFVSEAAARADTTAKWRRYRIVRVVLPVAEVLP